MENEPVRQRQTTIVAMKIPPFWPENTALWFAQIEAQFSLYNIADDATKFNHIVANLTANILQHVSDAVQSPPAANKYENIKTKITECYAESSQRKLEKLLSELTLGDRKPSQLLSQQRNLAGATISDDFLKTLWLRQLPVSVQSILAASSGTLVELSQLADKIVEASPQQNVSVVASYETTIAQLSKKVEELEGRMHKRSRSRSKSRAGRTESQQRVYDKCWYHFKFGDKAKNCRPPCTESKN